MGINIQLGHLIVGFIIFDCLFKPILAEADDQNPKVHIVYLGEKPHHDTKFTIDSHHQLLSTILGSKEKSMEAMVYSYKHGFSGFAAKLTKSQAQKLSEMSRVVRVVPSSLYKVHTTRSWDFLGLSSSPFESSNLLHRAQMGENVIIGVIDTGIWPESESFKDKGVGSIPSRWKGTCESGEQFNSTNCNKKIIGARWFMKGFVADLGRDALAKEYLSPRDLNGHGTHTASIAAGSFVANINYHNNAAGTVRGGAPLARLAIYKALWTKDAVGSTADILKAIDEAINDGVDVLSMSIGSLTPFLPEFNEANDIAFGSFHAIAKGISVVCAAGNSGPTPQTVENVAPWIFTVAANTIDRAFLASITTLPDNTTFLGQSLLDSKKDLVAELETLDTGRLVLV